MFDSVEELRYLGAIVNWTEEIFFYLGVSVEWAGFSVAVADAHPSN